MYYIHTKTITCCIMLSNKNLEFHMHYTGRKNCLGLHTQPTILWCIKYIFHVTLVWLHMNMTCMVRKSNLYINVQLHYISFLALLDQIDWLKVLTIHNAGLLYSLAMYHHWPMLGSLMGSNNSTYPSPKFKNWIRKWTGVTWPLSVVELENSSFFHDILYELQSCNWMQRNYRFIT